MSKIRKKFKAGLLAGVVGIVSIVSVCLALVNTFATASDYTFDGASLSLDGTTNQTAYT